MARKRKTQSTCNQNQDTENATPECSHEEDLFGFLVVSYVLHRLGLLAPQGKARLDAIDEPGKPTWIEHVEKSLTINSKFVEHAYALCIETMPPEKAILFILRGIDCPNYWANLDSYMNQPFPKRASRSEPTPSL